MIYLTYAHVKVPEPTTSSNRADRDSDRLRQGLSDRPAHQLPKTAFQSFLTLATVQP
jgi:hypothetical protein